jgi:omega-6 fatty acid desaturase (delta-12 desaturase)
METTHAIEASPSTLPLALTLAPYQAAWLRSVWQLVTSLLAYWFCWYLIYRSLTGPYCITLGLTLLAGGFATRTFSVYHDCTHFAFLPSHLGNVVVGYLTGMTVLAPFHQWQEDHWTHHATSGNLDTRGIGDTYFLTVQEYLALQPWQQRLYRIYRSPPVLFLIMPLYLYLISYRVVRQGEQATRAARLSVHITNLGIALWMAGLTVMIGARAFIMVELPLLLLVSFITGWFFVLQHQFEGIYFKREASWDFRDASLLGAAYMKMPAVLEWLSGYISYHHVHHSAPRVPYYHLPLAHRAVESLRQVKPLTVRAGWRAMWLTLWDEQGERFVGFDAIATQPALSTDSIHN